MVLNGGTGFDHLPGQNDQRYDPGHMAVDPISGYRFYNEGPNDRSCALFVCREYNALILFDQFDGLKPTLAATATGDSSWAIAGTNAAASLVTIQTTNSNAGGLLLTTNTTTADTTILQGNSNSVYGLINYIPDNSITFATQLVTSSAITGQTIWAGLKLTSADATATDADQTYFRYQDTANSGKWQTVDSTTGALTGASANAQDSGVTVATGSTYLLQIKVGNDLIPRYYINGIFVAKGQALTAGAAFKPFVGIKGTTVSQSVVCRWIRLVVPRSPIA
jgi:hypothetical protein